MSDATYLASYPFAGNDAATQRLMPVEKTLELPIQQRVNVSQVGALGKLGHAIDHLIHTQMFLVDAYTVRAEIDAVHILTSSRRAVFEESETVARKNGQINQWIAEQLRHIAN